MDVADFIIIGLLLIVTFFGARQGLIRQACITLGFVCGCFVAASAQSLLGVTANVPSDEPMFWAMLLLSILIVSTFFDIGLSVGSHINRSFNPLARFHIPDKIGGALVAAITLLIVAFLWSQLMARSPNQVVASQVSDSILLTSLRQTFPKLPSVFVQAANLINAHASPRVFLESIAQAETANVKPDGLTVKALAAKVGASVVKVTAEGCGGVSTGSGFVADADTIVTNAHVISGSKALYVTDGAGQHPAQALAFDPKLDVAILLVHGLKGSPLRLSQNRAQAGAQAITLGYAPGTLFAHGASVSRETTATGLDIYDDSIVSRTVYSINGSVEHGDSGGPLVDLDGEVMGLIFAKDADKPDTGYALTNEQYVGKLIALQQASPKVVVNTGSCGIH